ncbi:unnamed protein product [Brachionus calyciflorus]|uniref:SUZ RNA-binding domain-containing n=1 Tax=Brachionus calyciflorus TaxID=104777 RepID=A0A814G835_9BILA|nr:unnamed protein product [Brachionus calyciflorus]
MSYSASLNSGVLESSLNNKINTRSNSKDDEICDDWEQLDQLKIEKSLLNMKNNSSLSGRSNEDDEKNYKNLSNSNMSSVPFINNQFPQPAIKILKRPSSEKKLTDLPNQAQANQASQPIKTFEQREQEYAQARLRILGSAHPEQDVAPTNLNVQSNNINATKNNSSSPNLLSSNQINKPNINIIRDPIAPDGTRGFKNSPKNC